MLACARIGVIHSVVFGDRAALPLLSRKENPTLDGRKALKVLLSANKRLMSSRKASVNCGEPAAKSPQGIGSCSPA
jgi:acyl-coenzyme A synthetase/AMP-(fatty) acid ligase